MTRTTEQTEWVPTREWIAWSDTFDRRIGFRPEDRGDEEEAARARAEVDERHRGGSHDHDRNLHLKPWNLSNDVPTATPRQAGERALHRWMRDGEERVSEARALMELHQHQRHPNRAVRATMSRREHAEAREEALEVRRILAEHGKPEPWRDDAPLWKAPTPA